MQSKRAPRGAWVPILVAALAGGCGVEPHRDPGNGAFPVVGAGVYKRRVAAAAAAAAQRAQPRKQVGRTGKRTASPSPPRVLGALDAIRGKRPTVTLKLDRPPTRDGAPVALTASDGTGLAIVAYSARSVLQGPLALTELRLTFRNPRSRTIEGRFEVTLPPRATVSRFAMKVRGRWQEAEVVERQAARVAYEDFLHRRQDPALLEKKAGNRFRARVFPIPARGVKHLRLTYSQELTGRETAYRLPLFGMPKVERLDVRVYTAHRIYKLALSRQAPRGDVLVHGSAAVAGLRSGRLALVRMRPNVPRAAASIPSLLVIFDSSASRALGFTKQVESLGALIAALRKKHGDAMPLTVACFDQAVLPIYRGRADGFGAAARAKIVRHGALGASNLAAALRWAKRAGQRSRVLIVSDGVYTAGARGKTSELAKALAPSTTRIDALVVGGIRDETTLRGVVRGAVGRDGVLIDSDQSLDRIVARLSQRTLSDVPIVVHGASWYYPRSVDAVQQGDEVLVYAELDGKAASDTLRVSVGGVAQRVRLSPTSRPLLARSLARARIAALGVKLAKLSPRRARERTALERRIVSMSLEHRVVSSLTALLVLETDRDYRRFNIDRRALVDILAVSPRGPRLLRRSRRARALAAKGVARSGLKGEGKAGKKLAKEDKPRWLRRPRFAAGERARSRRARRRPRRSGTFDALIDGALASRRRRGAARSATRARRSGTGNGYGVGGLSLRGRGGGSSRGVATGAGALGLSGYGRGGGGTGTVAGSAAPARTRARGRVAVRRPPARRRSAASRRRALVRAVRRSGVLALRSARRARRRPRLRGRRARVPRVFAARAVVRGSLSRSIIRRVIRRRVNQVRHCYERAGARRAGILGVRFVITPSGRVGAASVSHDRLRMPAVSRCVTRVMRSWRFPAAKGGGSVTVNYPFLFRPAPARLRRAGGRSGIVSRAPLARRRVRTRVYRHARRSRRPVPPLSALSGRLSAFRRLMLRKEHDLALAFARRWRSRRAGDVLALVALGEAHARLGATARAARAYGSIIDLFPSRADMRRFAGNRLEALGRGGARALALDTYRVAKRQRPDHPNSHRLLAYAQLRAGQRARAFATLEAALARRYPGGRFRGVREVLLDDLGLVGRAWLARAPKLRARIVERLRAAGSTLATRPSLRFVMSWETDANDVDLHVYDGANRHAYYSRKSLASGGRLYADVTTGYGPEAFVIDGRKRAYPYTLQVHYYRRGPMGYGMGAVQVVQHDGRGGLRFAYRPFVAMRDGAYVEVLKVARSL